MAIIWTEVGSKENFCAGIADVRNAVDFMRAGVDYRIDGPIKREHKFETRYVESMGCEVLV